MTVVHSVNIMIFLLVVTVSWYIYYILRMSFMEMKDGSDGATQSEELLQLPSSEDKPSS